jgi:imidazolonepropionase-like amidohydrolase
VSAAAQNGFTLGARPCHGPTMHERPEGRLVRVSRLLGAVVCLVACATPQALPPPAPPKPPALPWEAAPEAVASVSSPAIALVGATLMTGTGLEIENAAITFSDGRILAVGPRAAVSVPEGAQVIDVGGRYVTPGLIDAHSHMGVYPMPEVLAHADGNESTRPVTAHVRAADSFWPQDPALSRALAAGVTTLLVLPGSANLVGGQGMTVKLHPGRGAEEMRFPGAPATLKMACGENPKRIYGERRTAPSTRMGNVAGYREAFRKAAEYGAKFADWSSRHQSWQRKTGDNPPVGEVPPSMPDRDYGLETLLGVLEGRVLVEVHCYRADEMLDMLAVADEFGFKVRAFHHAVEAYKIRDVLAARGVAVATWADWWGFKLEAYDTVRENLALLTEAGARGVLHSDSGAIAQRLNQEAAKAWSAGNRSGVKLDRGAALAWVTSNAAWVLGIEAQTGSLEPGKMADVVVWSGDPLSVYSRVDSVYVDGQKLFDRDGAGRRPSDFELGQGAELSNRNDEPRSLQKARGAAPSPAPGSPAPGNPAPTSPPAGAAPAPGAPAPGNAPAGAAPPSPGSPAATGSLPGVPGSSGAPNPAPAGVTEVKP